MSLNLGDYLAGLHGKRVAVIGVGISNTPLVKLLLEAGVSVTACDQKEEAQFGPLAQELKELGAELVLGPHYLDRLDHDVIFRSPGIRPDLPAFLKAQEKGSVLTSEMEVFFDVAPCPIIAVTGSDGKTTTTTLIAELLKGAGYTVHVGGNIGTPLLAQASEMKPSDYAVLELSSFQLMTLRKSPHIAVVTNLSPNHLDVHTSMDEYRQAKENLFLHQGPEDVAIFNYDNEETRTMAARAPGKQVFFSRSHMEEGVFVEDGMIIVSDEKGRREILSTADILIPGVHNVENYLAAIAAVEGLVSREAIEHTAKTFPGVEHRIELVRTLREVRYYNDSIASSPTRTIAGLRSFEEKLILIAGGYDKKIPFDLLGEEICRRVKLAVLTGHTAEKIRDSIVNAPDYRDGAPEIVMAPTFQEAVEAAHKRAQPGDVVILSPACASFDQFPNFAQRGQTFKRLVNDLT